MRFIRLFLMIWIGALLSSCAKDKIEQHRLVAYDDIEPSTARLVLVSGLDIFVNGQRLTNMGETSPATGGRAPIPTKYFPETGTPGMTYFIPQEFMGSEGKADISVGLWPSADIQIEDDYKEPWDYYFNQNRLLANETQLTQVPRPVVTPSSPEKILIRLINLSALDGINSDEGETLSLAYADGSLVSTTTSGIVKGAWSDYVEIPYGTYEFRVLVDGSDRQCPAVPPIGVIVESTDDATIQGTRRYFTQRRVFQPGGVYTVAVTGNFRGFEANMTGVPLNAFSVVTDRSPSTNRTYAKVQFVNAILGKALKAAINGSDIETGLMSFGDASAYHIISTGQQTIKASDEAGNPLIQHELSVRGGDNLTLWLYVTPAGLPAIHAVQNNMSGLVNLSDNPDGASGMTSIYDPLHFTDMNIQTRFLNFCPDIDYVTFTGRNGQSLGRPIERSGGGIGYSDAASNLQPGVPPDVDRVPYPYINITPEEIQVYRSGPGTVPGNRLFEVQSITAQQFINMPAPHYPNGWPMGEAGVYTVALIGRYTTDQKPSMVVIKHNQ
ncbi:hypothetical protein [Parapedobacter tibetensis]|uniref:hypothetical protein n=1 Tax=Parapedobacter tibetensis TaxID=2972951 RepID=UPI00214DC6C0|nr:hypothetical protein [Parapedobacter tibetensis]